MAIQVPYMLTCIFLSLGISHCLSTVNHMACPELARLESGFILHGEHGQLVLVSHENTAFLFILHHCRRCRLRTSTEIVGWNRLSEIHNVTGTHTRKQLCNI